MCRPCPFEKEESKDDAQTNFAVLYRREIEIAILRADVLQRIAHIARPVVRARFFPKTLQKPNVPISAHAIWIQFTIFIAPQSPTCGHDGSWTREIFIAYARASQRQ